MTDEKNTTKPIANGADWTTKLRYNKSFVAKLSLSDISVKEFYAQLTTKLLNFNKVKSRTRWNGVNFNSGRTSFAKIAFSGKKLCLYLAIDPSVTQESKYKAKDVSSVKKYQKTPSMLRIKSQGALNHALKLIDTAADGNLTLRKTPIEPILASDFPSDTFDNLLTRGLIRVINTGKKSSLKDIEEQLKAEADLQAQLAEQKAQNEKAQAELVEEQAKLAEQAKEQAEKEVQTEKITEKTIVKTIEKTVKKPEQEKTEQVMPSINIDESKTDIYPTTVSTVNGLVNKYQTYNDIVTLIAEGNTTAHFTQKTMLRSIDEGWVTAIENCLDPIDRLIRNPSHFIAETEEILPIEMTKKITGRSIAHLGQHSSYITMDGDDIIPKKMLNIFRDDSILTYENKFLNTLLARLVLFVQKRYDVAKKYGADEITDQVEYVSDFMDGDNRGKVTVKVEYSRPYLQKAQSGLLGTELWKRIEKIRQVLSEYSKSSFVAEMGKSYVHPPIMRTNAILKNKYFRQCLALWEFIESYEDAGYGLTIAQNAMVVSEEYCEQLAKNAAIQYLLFRHNAYGDFAEDGVLAKSISPLLHPKFIAETNKLEDYDETVTEEELQSQDINEELALQIALEADKLYRDPVLDGKDEIVTETTQVATEVATIEAEPTEEQLESGEFWWNGVRYIKTFHARIRLAEDQTKDYFLAIANELTKYNKVHMRVSNKFASFNYGRTTIARLNVTGKTLGFYMALDPTKQESKYFLKDVSNRKTYAETPALLKVRSDRALKYAQELIAILVETYNLKLAKNPPLPITTTDIATMSFNDLLAKGWIKEVHNNIASQGDNLLSYAEQTTTEQPTEQLAEPTEEQLESGEFWWNGVRYIKTFHARIRLAEDQTKDYFLAIANELTKYNKVHMRVSNKFASFNYGRTTIARLNVTGKTLGFYMALDPTKQESKYFLKDVSNRKTYAETPALLKVRSDRALKYAQELIAILVETYNLKLAKNPPLPITTTDIATMSFNDLLAKGWIKEVHNEPSVETQQEIISSDEEKPKIIFAPKETKKEAIMPIEMDTVSAARFPFEQIQTHGDNPTQSKTELPSVIASDSDGAVVAHAVNSQVQMEPKPKAETMSDIVQIAPESYSNPNAYGVDDASAFIKDIQPDNLPQKRKRKNFFVRLFQRIFGKKK